MDTRIKLLIISSFFFLNSVVGQELACGANPTAKDIRLLRTMDTHATLGDQIASDPTFIAISAHIVRRTDGTGGLTEQELSDAIDDVNAVYTLTNMTFFLFGDVNYIDDDTYFDFSSDDESALTSVHNVEHTINVYFFNSATSNGNAVCGYAYFPASQRDHIVMVNSCTTNGSTFPHELGHYFSLYHTHGKTNTGTTDELVDGSNCSTAGDDICDTAADPNLSGKINGSCQYVGTDTDSNGDTFVPNPRNLMSYSLKQCRDEFSQGQADRIVAAYQMYKTYLLSKDYAASFDSDIKSVCEGEQITFTNKSVGAVSYAWTFEGGTPATSNEENPVVTYNTVGNYDVSLVITEDGGEMDTKEFTDYVTVKGGVTSDITSKSGGFEEAGLLEDVLNDDGGITFQQTSAASTEGSQSVYMNFFSYSQEGEVDYLIASALNTSSVKSFTFSFDYAYAPYSTSFFDGLAVVYRDPCEDWVTVWEKFGEDLQTKAAQTSSFTPAAEDWTTETITIQIPTEIDVTEIAFKSINGYGNNLYIDNYSVIEAATFSIDNIEVVDASCFDSEDGSITVVTSSTENLTYSRDNENFSTSNTFSNLGRGEYTITIKNDQGVTLNYTVEVGSPDELEIGLVVEDAPCGETGSVEVTMVGGSGSYSYSLNGIESGNTGSISDLPVGVHTLVVTDLMTNCDATVDFEVLQVDASFTIELDVVLPSCPDAADGSISVIGLDGSYQFRFDGGDFSSSSTLSEIGEGTYTVTVLDSNGCDKSLEEVVVAENEYPEVPEIIETIDGLTVATEANQTVQWYLDGAELVGSTQSTLNASGRGSYTVEVANGACSAISEPFIILSVKELQEAIEVYPNPVQDWLEINLPGDLAGKVVSVRIRDFTGRLLSDTNFSKKHNVGSFKSGMYLLELSGDGFVVSKRFLKR